MWISGFHHQVLAHGFAQSLLVDDAGSILATATSWDELEIQEEAESGSSITSKIRLPVQVSRGHHEGKACFMDRRDLRKDQPNAAPEEERIVCAPFSCGAKWADGQARGRSEKPFTLLSCCSTDSVLVREQLALQWTHQWRAAWRVEPRPPDATRVRPLVCSEGAGWPGQSPAAEASLGCWSPLSARLV